jgi:mono/diheme cytochrome c family protein
MLRLFANEPAARLARRFLFGLALVAAGTAWAQQPAFTPRDETPEEFTAGAGRDETFYSCTACHNFKLVAQQGMSRRQWDEILSLMTEKHGMPPLDDKDRDVVLNYLESAYPPRAPAGRGWQNPFLNR